jgi:hypothetical protein
VGSKEERESNLVKKLKFLQHPSVWGFFVGLSWDREFKLMEKFKFLQIPSVWGHAAAATVVAGVFYILLDIFARTKSSGEKVVAAFVAFFGYWCGEILKALYYN